MESHPLVYLRADGNDDIATGHLMRCLSIARALRRRKAVAAFIVSDSLSVSLLTDMFTPQERADRAFPILQLQTDYKNPDQELPAMQSILSAHNAAAVLVDSYFATPGYLSALQKLTCTSYIDDLQAFDPPADLVINYDLTVDPGFYTKAGRLLGGSAYTPLRRQFSACGGLLKRLTASPRWQNVTFHVLTGPMHVHRAGLLNMAQADGRIVLCEGVQDMASLMASCDLAFSAGGTTLYELCAVGVPSVSYTMADNQIPGVLAFSQAGLIPYVGDVRNHPDFFGSAMAALEDLMSVPAARRSQSARMKMAIDGAGADRIAEALTTKVH